VGRQEDGGPALAGLVQQPVERLLHQRVQALRRLVQDQHVWLVDERLDQPDLLLVPVGQRRDMDVEVQVEAFGQLTDRALVDAAP
jgi:hypothetical protein